MCLSFIEVPFNGHAQRECLTLTTLVADVFWNFGQEQILHQDNINNFLNKWLTFVIYWLRNGYAIILWKIFLMNSFDSCVMIWNGNSYLIHYNLFIISDNLYWSLYTNSNSFKEQYFNTYIYSFVEFVLTLLISWALTSASE